MEVIGDGVVIDLGERAFLGSDAGGEIPEVVDSERHVGVCRLANGLAVVDGLDERQDVEVFLHLVGDLIQDASALRGRRLAPGFARIVCGVEREFDVFGRRARDFANRLTRDWREVGEILSAYRGDKFAADEIVVARLDNLPAFQLIHSYMLHGVTPPETACWGLGIFLVIAQAH